MATITPTMIRIGRSVSIHTASREPTAKLLARKRIFKTLLSPTPKRKTYQPKVDPNTIHQYSKKGEVFLVPEHRLAHYPFLNLRPSMQQLGCVLVELRDDPDIDTLWVITKVEHDVEGDLEAWVAEPSGKMLQEYPEFEGHTIKILNN